MNHRASDFVDIYRHNGILLHTVERPVPFAEQSVDDLLTVLLRSEELASQIARQRIESLKYATRQELGLATSAYTRLMAGIELGKGVEDAKSQYNRPMRLDSSVATIDSCHMFRADRVVGEITLAAWMNRQGDHRVLIRTLVHLMGIV
jgi:hypothetical protein